MLGDAEDLGVVDEHIKGTELRRGEKAIWGDSGHVAGFSGFDDLALDYERAGAEDVQPLAEYYVGRNIYPTSVLMGYRLGWTWFNFHDFVVYREFIGSLVREGEFVADGPRGRSLFLLPPYDWRLDNRVAAVRLASALPGFRREYERQVVTASPFPEPRGTPGPEGRPERAAGYFAVSFRSSYGAE